MCYNGDHTNEIEAGVGVLTEKVRELPQPFGMGVRSEQ